MESKLIAFRDTDLHERITAKAKKDGKSFADTARDLMRWALDTRDSRIAEVQPFRGRTGLRLVDDPRGKGKSLNSVALRDNPLEQMYQDSQIDEHQREIGKHIARYFELARGNQVKTNAIGKERIDFSHPAKPVSRTRYELVTRQDYQEAVAFLREAREIVGAKHFAVLRRVLDYCQPTMQVEQFRAALNALAPLCGYANQKLAA
jgi:hypothetical protein